MTLLQHFNEKPGRDKPRNGGVAPARWKRTEIKCQRVCKPGSVPLLRGSATIPLGRHLRAGSSNQPGRRAGTCPYAAPIRSCSRWGLPCRFCYQSRGALLPHPFTLACPLPDVGGLLSVALSLGSPPPGVTRHRCFRGARTFLDALLRRGRPTLWRVPLTHPLAVWEAAARAGSSGTRHRSPHRSVQGETAAGTP